MSVNQVEQLRAVGARLADLLADQGFRWVPWPGCLYRERDHRIEEIHLDGLPDKPGKPAGRATTRLHMAVRDRELQHWRVGNPELVLSKSDFLVGHPVGYLTGAAAAQLDLRDAAGRDDALTDTVAVIRDQVLPWFDVTTEPDLLAGTAPDCTLRAGGYAIVEWLAGRDRRDLIGVVLDRVLTAYPGDRTGYEGGRQIAAGTDRPTGLAVYRAHDPGFAVTGEPTKGFVYTAERLGWSAAKHGQPDHLSPAEVASPAAVTVPGAPGAVLRPLQRPDGTPMTVVVTGRVEGLTRKRAVISELTRTQADDLVRAYGGTPTGSVSRRTDLVIAGERAGAAKTVKATTLGVPIMPAVEFTHLCRAYEDRDTDRAAWIVASVLAERV